MAEMLTMDSVMQCPHGGSVNVICSNTKAMAGGAFILRSTDTFLIVGCGFAPAGVLHQCVRVQWIVTTMRNQVVANPVLAKDSIGLCLAGDSAPQGPVLIQQTQSHVKGM